MLPARPTSRPILLASLTFALAGCAVQPEPFSDVQLTAYIDDKATRVTANQEALAGPLTLQGAMARALKYNLDKEVEIMQTRLAEQQLRVAHYSLLPSVVAGSGYADRSNYAGGSSVRLIGPTTVGEESLSSSASSERDVRSADIRFSWHILDFGLSYVRARQAADRVLIAEETRRRVSTRMLENVRAAYWRAVAATRLLQRLGILENRVRSALKNAKSLGEQGDSSPLTALTFERELVEIQREIRRLHSELGSAKTQLAALVNIDPGQHYDVAVPATFSQLSAPTKSPADMIALALANRSELREVAYQQRINARDAEAALLEMLPGLSLDASTAWNSNRYLYNGNWVSWGAQASWNLLKVFSYPERRAEAEAKDDLLDARARAVVMAIMTQVHVARARLASAQREFQTASHFHSVQLRIVDQIRNALASGKISEQSAIREEMNGLVATVKRDLAYAEVQSSGAALLAAMGMLPVVEGDTKSMTLADISRSLAK
jgi:outer membrane protein TolC